MTQLTTIQVRYLYSDLFRYFYL